MNLIFTLGFIIGAVLGSFIKVFADRSLRKVPFGGRSYCEYCKHKLAAYDLFPILSYLFLKGKCRYCKKKVSVEYFLVELLMGFLITLLLFLFLPKDILTQATVPLSLTLLSLIFKIFAVCVLVITFLTDIKKGLIPDRITYPGIIIALIFLILTTIYKIYILYYSLTRSMLGRFLLPPRSDYFARHALLLSEPLYLGLFAALIMIFFFGGIILFTRGRGMGGGDLKLGVFMGLILGFPGILVALMVAFVSGSVVGIALLIAGKKHFGQTIPFGPFLTLGGIIAIFWGEKIINWYLNLKILT